MKVEASASSRSGTGVTWGPKRSCTWRSGPLPAGRSARLTSKL
ncbi:hypothetical protein [Archangium gephyra]|nr:hypothetical protein [Archangium gephyra]